MNHVYVWGFENTINMDNKKAYFLLIIFLVINASTTTNKEKKNDSTYLMDKNPGKNFNIIAGK